MSLQTVPVAVLIILLAAAPAAAQPKAPGVTDTEITIGLTGPLSGPAAIYGNLMVAKEAWARHVNDQGGINGRKVKFIVKDDGFNPGRAVANIKELKDTTFINVGMVGSAVINAAKDEVAEARFPVVYPYGNPVLWARQPREKLRGIFVVYPDYVDEGDFLVTHAVSKLGAQKIATFVQNDEWGKAFLEGVTRGVRGPGGKGTLVADVRYEATERELGTQALKLKESGADTLVTSALNTACANLVKEMAKVGYRPRIMASFPLGDHLVMYRLAGELWEGAYFNVLGAIPGEPEAKPVLDILLKNEPKLQGKESTALAGAGAMMLAVEGLKKAGRTLTRESFIEGMEGIKGFTTMGLSAPINFGPNQHHGLNAVRLMRAKKAADFSYEQVTGYQIFKPLF